MAQFDRRHLLATAGLAWMGMGCASFNPNLLSWAFGGREPKVKAECPLTVQPKKKDAKVVVLVSAQPGLHPDLAGVDRMLNAELITMLTAGVQENDERVLVMKMPKIDEFKQDNPNWRSFHPFDIGVKLGADYVIDVEIDEMELFKPESRGQLLKGLATIGVNAYDMSKAPLKEPVYKLDYSPEYPRGREEPIEGRDTRFQVSQFRMKFIQVICAEIVVKFIDATPQRRVD